MTRMRIALGCESRKTFGVIVCDFLSVVIAFAEEMVGNMCFGRWRYCCFTFELAPITHGVEVPSVACTVTSCSAPIALGS